MMIIHIAEANSNQIVEIRGGRICGKCFAHTGHATGGTELTHTTLYLLEQIAI